jgi:Na+/H+-translocating membrane pyrophosphatase
VSIFQEIYVTVVTNGFFSEANRKRTLITIGVNIFLQLTGQNFSSKYGTVFIQSIGTVNPFVMSCINSAVGIVVVLITQLLSDKTGRVYVEVAQNLKTCTDISQTSSYRWSFYSDCSFDGNGWVRNCGPTILEC